MEASETAQGLAFAEREIVLRVDFKDLDADGCPSVSLRFLQGPRHPREGETVYLLDGDSHGCLAVVERVTGWSARVRPDWSSWTGDGDPPRAVSGA